MRKKKSYYNGRITAVVTNDECRLRYKKVEEFNVEDFSKMAVSDLVDTVAGRHPIFKIKEDVLCLSYKFGMYGTVSIATKSKADLKKVVTCPWLQLYMNSIFCLALEELVYPEVEKEGHEKS